MKGDFSRIRFNLSKQYTAVLEQQGRVSLDADANEQSAIDAWLRRTESVDVIGEYGAPVNDAGFAITVAGNQIAIGAGRYYVEGLLCENTTDALPYQHQPYLLHPSPTDATLIAELPGQGSGASVQVFLQVWQRLVIPLDDPSLREPALGQADTTVRLQTVWRVVASLALPPGSTPQPGPVIGPRRPFGLRPPIGLLGAKQRLASTLVSRNPILSRGGAVLAGSGVLAGTGVVAGSGGLTGAGGTPPPAAPVDCCTAMYADAGPAADTGSMAAMTSGGGSECSCLPIPAAGYQGLENQLYRVEIHQGGSESTATFKWSRENGSVVAAIQSVSGSTIAVDSLGPDANLGFQANQWVEISDDTYLFGEVPNQPGILYQIQSVDPTGPSITLTTPVAPVDPAHNARVRRWDQTGTTAGTSGLALQPGSWIALENGIQVNFGSGSYQSGDFWTIPARSASGQIEWPPDGSDGEFYQPPESMLVYNAPLACIHWDPSAKQYKVEDCRRLFSPLTALTAPAAANALHVTKTNWANDALMTADQWVANGLSITFDGAPTGPVTGGNFIVTIESVYDPFPAFTQRFALSGESISRLLPSTILRTYFVIDSTVAVKGNVITWTMPYANANELQKYTVTVLNAGLIYGAQIGQYARVRVRLIGNAIYSTAGSTPVYLDGKCFGQVAQNANGTKRNDLLLPSGSDAKASDFESWFNLAPTLLVTGITVPYTALYAVVVNNTVTGVTASPPNPSAPPPTVNPYVTVSMNYSAIADTQLTLTLTDAGGAASQYASIQSPVTVRAGEAFANATITITGNPLASGKPETVTIAVNASVATAVGPVAGSPVTFTLTGGISQTIIP